MYWIVGAVIVIVAFAIYKTVKASSHIDKFMATVDEEKTED